MDGMNPIKNQEYDQVLRKSEHRLPYMCVARHDVQIFKASIKKNRGTMSHLGDRNHVALWKQVSNEL